VSYAEALDCVKEGVAAARAGEKDRARRLFLDAIELDPDNDAARLWLASVADSPLEALDHLEHVLTINPEHEKARAAAQAARVRAGVTAAKTGDIELARSLLRKAVADDPECEKAWIWLAGVAESPDEAVAALIQARQINPDNEQTRIALEDYHAECEAGDTDAGDTEPSDPVVPPLEAPKEPHTVLLVDDSPMVRKLVAYALADRGYVVRTAADSAEAVANLRDSGIPDLILLDVTLPGQDGYQFCRLLRQDHATANVPVVLLTDQASMLNGARRRLVGADEMFAKSLELDGLLDVVDRLCLTE
jgi:CheY-like chemotaxis protein